MISCYNRFIPSSLTFTWLRFAVSHVAGWQARLVLSACSFPSSGFESMISPACLRVKDARERSSCWRAEPFPHSGDELSGLLPLSLRRHRHLSHPGGNWESLHPLLTRIQIVLMEEWFMGRGSEIIFKCDDPNLRKKILRPLPHKYRYNNYDHEI